MLTAIWSNLQRILLGLFLFTAACSSMPQAGEAPQANLTALSDKVTRIRGKDLITDVPPETAVDIQVDDEVKVDDAGRGLLRFPSGLNVEIFRETDLQLENHRLDAGDILFVRLRQVAGHTLTDLQQEANAYIVITTDFATITSLDPDTKIAICHDPTLLTCLVVLEGKTEVEAEGKIVTVEGGESTYILAGMPPVGPICAILPEVEQWLDQKRALTDLPALGELVAGWPQVPCAQQAAVSGAGVPSSQGMVLIDAGQFTVGSQNEDGTHLPVQQVDLAAYWIDVYEVTNADYRAYLEATGAPPPEAWAGLANDHPVKGVTWNQAADFCAWANKRLPSEAEWEVAARGPGSPPPLYPWGDEQMAGNQVNSLPKTETYPVGSFPFNMSQFGVFDMAGNVWEWVGDPYDPTQANEKILRGGRHGLLTDMAHRQPAASDSASFVPFAGFRCAADPVEGE